MKDAGCTRVLLLTVLALSSTIRSAGQSEAALIDVPNVCRRFSLASPARRLAAECPRPSHALGDCHIVGFEGCRRSGARRHRALTARTALSRAQNLTIPCGFHAPSGYDAVRDHYAQRRDCPVIIVTIIFAFYDFLRNPEQPPSADEQEGICYVALIDVRSSEAPFLVEPYNKTVWEFWLIDPIPLPTYSIQHNELIPKLIVQRLFPNAVITMYHDGKVTIRGNPWSMIARTLHVEAPERAPSTQPAKACYYAEKAKFPMAVWKQALWKGGNAEFRKELTKLAHNRSAIREQFEVYSSETKEFGRAMRAGAADTCMLIRVHGFPCTRMLECVWFNELMYFHYQNREQLSFPYILDTLDLNDMVNYFHGPMIGPEWFTVMPHRYQYAVLRIRGKLPKGHRIPSFGIGKCLRAQGCPA
eukprot:NODE_1565_length_1493_cov_53.261080_g1412_i0.p1 GENE.NODE_1565_length_1493_cov_53.261080_g1412_i0~~NODE_1565_length_1493_cov_53.261080_g1412_i0.p1  ORF type:complete len:447 (-),score=83.64 NODE_1565_length_1493_cov_53.261080_g1412_i0:152-1399(-)